MIWMGIIIIRFLEKSLAVATTACGIKMTPDSSKKRINSFIRKYITITNL